MKAIICSALLFLGAFIRSEASIVGPLVILGDTGVITHNFHEASFSISIIVTAPAENDIYIDKTFTPLNLNLYGHPGQGTRWEFVDAPGSPARPATLHFETFDRISGSISGDTISIWKVAAGTTSSFRANMDISMNPFEENPPRRYLALELTHVNWGADPAIETPFFAALGSEFQTDYAQLGTIPEPMTFSLGSLGILCITCRRNRKVDRF
jgi:hypothetical protein